MKNLFPFLSVLAIMAIFFTGCNKSDSTKSHLWPPIDTEADSIVEMLNLRTDSAIFEAADSIWINRLDSIGRTKGIPQLRARALYFEVEIIDNKMGDSLNIAKLEEALTLTDSAAYPYDYHRFIQKDPRNYFPSGEGMTALIDASRFMEEYGDSLRLAEISNKIAVKLLAVGDTLGSCRYFNKAMNLYTAAGKMPQAGVVGFNMANLKNEMGDTAGAVALLDTLMQYPEIEKYNRHRQLYDLFRYYNTKDIAFLRHMIKLGEEPRPERGVLPLGAIILADHYRQVGNRDSMLYYKHRFSASIPYIKFNGIEICDMAHEVYLATNSPDSAKQFHADAELMRATRQARIETAATTRAENEGLIRQANAALDAAMQQNGENTAWKFAAMCVVALAIFGGITLMLIKNMKSRSKVADTEPDERKQALELLRSCGKFTPDMLPDFRARLAESHPDLSPAESRLACLIYMGLDTKEIASTLSIAPDSVKKARQRLRARMNLSPTTDLPRHLKNL